MRTLTLGLALALPAAAAAAGPEPKEVDAVLEKAYDALKARQAVDGSFAAALGGPGITALTAAGLVRAGKAPGDPVVAKALGVLEKSVQPNGGIYSKRLGNYTTSVAVLALKEANADGKYDAVIAKAGEFLKGLQKGDESGDEAQAGGVGYDGKGRPDLSNTHFFIDALLAAGVPRDDPAVKDALAYVSRCQNAPSEFNKLPFAAKATPDDKGGFVYVATAKVNPKDPNATPDGGLRSAGSMTYAGLKSFVYAGLSKDDPRVKAALDWVGRHYTLSENPGQGARGLFYYYVLFAKAMDALGADEFTDAKGVKHDWRKDLFEELKRRQKPDGSWANDNGAFFESSPELATSYAVIALGYCKPKAK